MQQVEFKFNIDEKVRTVLQTEGVISHAMVGRDGKMYYVKTIHTSEWFYEDQLSAIQK